MKQSAKNNGISKAVIGRLARYHRYLAQLKEDGVTRTSSKKLADYMLLTASQIRQDLNCFGGFGQQGYGYNVDQLYNEISKILKLNKITDAVLIGAGNLGRTISVHIDFERCGFNLAAVFDTAPAVVGSRVGGHVVKDIAELERFCSEKNPKMAILCIPGEKAEELTLKLEQYGVHGIWNFTQQDLYVEGSDVYIENIRLSDSLMALRYNID